MISANLHEHLDGLALHGVGHANSCGLGDRRMRHQSAFHLGRADAMSGHIEHVIVSAQHCDVSVFVFHGDIARHIATGNHLPVAFVARRIAPHGAQHVGERALEHQPSSDSSWS